GAAPARIGYTTQPYTEVSMKFEIRSGSPASQRTACAIVPVYANGVLGDAARELDEAGGGLITAAVDSRDIRGDAGSTLMLTATGGLPAKRILLVGLGTKSRLDRRAFRKAARAAFALLGR